MYDKSLVQFLSSVGEFCQCFEHAVVLLLLNRRGTSGSLSLKLQSGKPEDFPILPQLHIYVMPSCSYRVSISIAWTELYGQVIEPLLCKFCWVVTGEPSVLNNRLRIGHTRLTNSYFLKGESQAVCEACHSPLTVKHILVDCTRYCAACQRYFGVDTLKDIFENVASCNTVAYVKDIGFYNRI